MKDHSTSTNSSYKLSKTLIVLPTRWEMTQHVNIEG